MICRKCKVNYTTGNLRVCDECVSVNTRRQRRERLTPPEVVRGSRWRYKRIPLIEGILDSVHAAGYIHLEIADELGEFTWRSTIDHFLQAWEKVEPQSDLDREVENHLNKTRRVPLQGQKSIPLIGRPLTKLERIGYSVDRERREDGHDLD